MKTERVHFRVSLETKETMHSSAAKKGLNYSEYFRWLVEQDAKRLSHEEQIQNSLHENTFINRLFTNQELTLKSKQIIAKELRKYVGH